MPEIIPFTDAKARLARIRQDKSVLDSVIQEAAHLQGALGQGDRTKLVEYLDAIRDVERRIQYVEQQGLRLDSGVDAGPSLHHREH